MNMIEAKQFEYAVSLFREYWVSAKRKEDINYKIIWNLNNELVTFNTYKIVYDKPVLYETRYQSTYNSEISDYSKENDVFSYIRHFIYDNFLKINFSDYWLLYKHPEHLFRFLSTDIDFKRDSSTKLDTSFIYNVSKLFSDKKLDFVKTQDNFTVNPVSLIKIPKPFNN